MPFVIYIFALSAFALGLAEFVPIGLTDVIAGNLNVSVEQTGGIITSYALGATFAAPILTAVTSGWMRKRVMLVTALVFSAGSLVAALSTSLPLILAARFIAGMGHGLFLAVASSTAARLAGPKKAGTAVAVVFGGFTIALAIGVPVSTYLGGIIEWRPVFAMIALFGAIGWVGLLMGMQEPPAVKGDAGHTSVRNSLKAMFNPILLFAALVTVLGYAGSFTAFTYIAPLLTDVTGISVSTVGLFMLAYGVLAAVGNILGGKMTDRYGANQASVTVLAGIGLTSLALWFFSASPIMMGVLTALLGMFSYAAVPALQARLLVVAEQKAPHALGVASGLNIAGFNSGIALGSVLGGLTIKSIGIEYMGVTGAIVSGLALIILLSQVRHQPDTRHVSTIGH